MPDHRTIGALIAEGQAEAPAADGTLTRRLTDALMWLSHEHEDRYAGLNRWCHWQDRLHDTLERLGLREQVFADMDRDGWVNEARCRHDVYRQQVEAMAKLVVTGNGPGRLVVDATALMSDDDHGPRRWWLYEDSTQPGLWVQPESGVTCPLASALRGIANVYLDRSAPWMPEPLTEEERTRG